MKAISLWQPWASLLVAGLKRVETRSWRTSYRGPLLVHAGKTWNPALAEIAARPLFFRPALESLGMVFVPSEAACRAGWGLPFGAVIGRVDLVECYPTEDVLWDHMGMETLPSHPVDQTRDGRLRLWPSPEQAFGDYRPGRWAWLTANAVRFAEPIPYPGRQQVFDVPDSILPTTQRGDHG